MAKLYALDLHGCADPIWRELLPQLPKQRQERAMQCRFPEDQIRSIGAGWLLQYALEQAGIPAAQQVFDQTGAGKPYLPHHPQFHFSLSHSGRWVVCAVSHDPVGVDVEQPRCTWEIARRFFHRDELAGLEQLPVEQQMEQLNRLWTAKEAFVKAMGRGLTVPLNSFRVRLTENNAELEQTCTDLPYVLHEYVLQPCRMCLCCTDSRPQPEFLAP